MVDSVVDLVAAVGESESVGCPCVGVIEFLCEEIVCVACCVLVEISTGDGEPMVVFPDIIEHDFCLRSSLLVANHDFPDYVFGVFLSVRHARGLSCDVLIFLNVSLCEQVGLQVVVDDK